MEMFTRLFASSRGSFDTSDFGKFSSDSCISKENYTSSSAQNNLRSEAKNFKTGSKRKYKTAFSLIELAIVVTIVSILVAGALAMMTSSANNAKIKITNERIQTIYKAFGTYLLVNAALPCPAVVTSIKTSSANYGGGSGEINTTVGADCIMTGVYNSNGGIMAYGMVPVRVLGLSDEFAEDGFGSKFAYIVEKASTAGDTSPFSTNASTILTIKEKLDSSLQTIVTNAIFAIVSYGSNKSGAFPANSATQITRSSDADEMENDTNSGAYDEILVTYSGGSSAFDDVVFYKTRNALLQDVDAFSVLTCASGTVTISSVNYTMPTDYYDQKGISSTTCTSINAGYTHGPTYPEIKCGLFGTWATYVSTPVCS